MDDILILRERKIMGQQCNSDVSFIPLPILEDFINEVISELELIKKKAND